MLEKVLSSPLAPLPGLLLAPTLGALFYVRTSVPFQEVVMPLRFRVCLRLTHSHSWGPLRPPHLLIGTKEIQIFTKAGVGAMTHWASSPSELVSESPSFSLPERGRRQILVTGGEAWPSRAWWNRFPEKEEVF